MNMQDQSLEAKLLHLTIESGRAIPSTRGPQSQADSAGVIGSRYTSSLQSRIERLKKTSLARHQRLQFLASSPSESNREGNDLEMRSVESTGREDLSLEEAMRLLELSCRNVLPLGNDDEVEGQEDARLDAASRTVRFRAIRRLIRQPPELHELWISYKKMRAELAFHQHNAKRPAFYDVGRSEPERGPMAPWIPSSTGTSKHKNGIRSKSRATGSTKKAMRISAHTSEIQSRVLISLLSRVLTKLALGVWRHATQRSTVSLHWINRIEKDFDVVSLHHAYKAWKRYAFPAKYRKQELMQIEDSLIHKMNVKSTSIHFRAWRCVNRATVWDRDRRLKRSFYLWRCVALSHRLRGILLEMALFWHEQSIRLKAFLWWKRTARRLKSQKEALLLASERILYVYPEYISATRQLFEKPKAKGTDTSNLHALTWQPSQCEAIQEMRHEVWMITQAIDAATFKARSQLKGAFLSDDDQDDFDNDEHLQFSTCAVKAAVKTYDPSHYVIGSMASCDLPQEESIVDAIAAELVEVEEAIETSISESTSMEHRILDNRGDLEKVRENGFEIELKLMDAIQALEDKEAELKGLKDALDRQRTNHADRSSILQRSKELLADLTAQKEEAGSAMLTAREQLLAAHRFLQSKAKNVAVWKDKAIAAAADVGKASAAAKPVAMAKLKEIRSRLEEEVSMGEHAKASLPQHQSDLDRATQEFYALTAQLHRAQEAVDAAERFEKEACDVVASMETRKGHLRNDIDKLTGIIEGLKVELGSAKRGERSLSASIETMKKALLTLNRKTQVLRQRYDALEDKHAKAITVALEKHFRPAEVFFGDSQPTFVDASSLLSIPPVPMEVYAVETSGRLLTSHTSYNDNIHRTTETQKIEMEAEESEEEESDDELVTEISSLPPTMHSARRRMPVLSVVDAAIHFHASRLLRKSIFAWRKHNVSWKEARRIADTRYCRNILPPIVEAWRQWTEAAVAAEISLEEQFVLRTSMKAWRNRTIKSITLRSIMEEMVRIRDARMKRNCLKALQAHSIDRKRDQCMIRTWRMRQAQKLVEFWNVWANNRRQLNHILMEYEDKGRIRLLAVALQTWRMSARARKLLRSVLERAQYLWSLKESRVFSFEEEFGMMKRYFNAWQIAVQLQLSGRVSAAAEITAATHHHHRLLRSSLCAFEENVERARRSQDLMPLLRSILNSWRLSVMTTQRKPAQRFQLQRAFESWRMYVEANAVSKSVFYVKWNVDNPMRASFDAWIRCTTQKEKWRHRRRMAAFLMAPLSSSSPAPISTISNAESGVIRSSNKDKMFAVGSKLESSPDSDALQEDPMDGQTASMRESEASSWSLSAASASSSSEMPPRTIENNDERERTTTSSSFSCAAQSWRSHAEEWRSTSQQYRHAEI